MLKLYNKKVSDYVFINPATKDRWIDIRMPYKRACDRADIKDLKFHDLRHTAATRMVAAEIDLIVVQEILGHADIQTTMRYAHPVPERKKLVIEALENYSKDTKKQNKKSKKKILSLVD